MKQRKSGNSVTSSKTPSKTICEVDFTFLLSAGIGKITEMMPSFGKLSVTKFLKLSLLLRKHAHAIYSTSFHTYQNHNFQVKLQYFSYFA